MTTKKSNTPKSIPERIMRELGLTQLAHAKELEDLLSSLDCVDGFLAAMKNKKEMTLEPESIDGMVEMPEWCDDCDTYHREWYGLFFRTENGRLYADSWTCDDCGDWDSGYSVDLCTEDGWREYMIMQEEISYETATAAWHEYNEHVAETGEDPLNNIYIPGKDTSVKVLATVKEHQGRAYLSAIDLPDDAPSWVGYVKERENWMTYFGFPFFLVEFGEYFYMEDYSMQAIHDLLAEDKLEDHAAEIKGGELHFTWEIKLPMSADMLAEEKKAAAKAVLLRDQIDILPSLKEGDSTSRLT